MNGPGIEWDHQTLSLGPLTMDGSDQLSVDSLESDMFKEHDDHFAENILGIASIDVRALARFRPVTLAGWQRLALSASIHTHTTSPMETACNRIEFA